MLAAALLVTCGGEPPASPPELEVLTRLVEDFDHAQARPVTLDLDLGTEVARPYLAQGWANDETAPDGRTFIWNRGGHSVIELPLAEHGPLDLEIRARAFSWEGAPEQSVTVKVNAVVVKKLTIPGDWADLTLAIPSARLHPGLNRIEFAYEWSTAPSEVTKSKDDRKLAVAWDHLRLRTTHGPRAHEGEGRVEIPYGASAAWSLLLPPGARLEWDGLPAESGERGVLAISVAEPGEGTESLFALDGTTLSTPLTTEDAAVALRRVRLTALPPADDPYARGSLTVRHPRIVAPEGALGERRVFPRRPNVLVYLVDTLRRDHLGCYGYDQPTSPNLDALAAEAVVFEQPVAESPWTRSSVASLLTGVYPQTHTAVDRTDRIPDSVRTLAEMMRDAGYATGAVTTNGNVSEEFGFRRGFDHFVYLPEAVSGPVHHSAAEVNTEAWRWLERTTGDQPFFLYLHVSDPHGPYTPVPRFRRQFAPDVPEGRFGTMDWLVDLHRKRIEVTPELVAGALQLYDAEIAYTDEHFGRLVDGLKRRGLFDDTLIVFTSDHGEEFHEHNDWEHGNTLYSEVLDIPLVIKYPHEASVSPGRSERAVQLTDIAPTALHAAAVTLPEHLPGESLFTAERVAQTEVRPAFSHLKMKKTAEGIQEGSFKFLRFQNPESTLQKRLYDHTVDPGEQRDLLKRNPDRAEMLEGKLDAHALRYTSEVPSEPVEIDDSLAERLRALGYLE